VSGLELQRPGSAFVVRWQAVTAGYPLPLVLFAAAAALRLASFGVFYTASLLTGHGGHTDYTDPLTYDHWAWIIAQTLRTGNWINITPSTLAGTYDVGFEYWVGFIYAVVGHHPEVPRIIDALLAAFVPPAIYLSGRATSLGEQVSRRAAWLAVLWPLTLYWSGYDLIKDPVTWFLIALGMLVIVERDWARFVVFGVVVTSVLELVRSYVGAGMFLLLPLSALVHRHWKALVGITAALVASQLLISALALHPPLWSPAPYRGNGHPVVAQPATKSSSSSSSSGLNELIRRLFHVGSQSTTKVEGTGSDITSILSGGPAAIAARLVVGLAITALGPRLAIHDVIHPTIDTGMYPGMLVWLPLIPFSLLGFFRGIRSRDPSVLLFALLAAGLWVGLSFSYAGVFRQREMAFPPTLLFTALGLQRPWPRNWLLAYVVMLAFGLGLLVLRELGAY
jgi:hypothetical protein